MLLGTFSRAQVPLLKAGLFQNSPQSIGPVRSDPSKAMPIHSRDGFALLSSGQKALVEPNESESLTMQVSVCSNELPYYWNGDNYSQSGNYSKQISQPNGKVDQATLKLTVLQAGTWHPDADGDGFGNSNNPILFCDAPSGFVSNALDCNDNDASIQEPTEYFIDGDRDGFGSEIAVSLCASSAPFGFSAVHTDCDDKNSSLHPNSIKQCKGIANELNAATVYAYPNPGAGKYQLDVQRMNGKADVQVYDVQGVLLLELRLQELSQSINLNLENQPAGFYWLKFTTSGFSQNIKLIKQ